MYKKIWGLEQLERMRFRYPPYVVVDITEEAPPDVKEYVLTKIRQVGIPKLENDRLGVTIRVSLSGVLDKIATHGGLHILDEGEVLKRVLAKYQQYKPNVKIVIQHTVDARCSGTILKENDHATIEAIFGDAPPLLEGQTSDYERWVFFLRRGRWKKERAYTRGDGEVVVLTLKDLQTFEGYVKLMPNKVYLEWSISKQGELYFYEYYKLNNETH